MKPVYILLINLLVSLSSRGQNEPMSMKAQDTSRGMMPMKMAKTNEMPMNMAMGSGNMRLPFYTKKGNRVIYHLYISDTIVNYTGKKRKAFSPYLYICYRLGTLN